MTDREGTYLGAGFLIGAIMVAVLVLLMMEAMVHA